MPALKKKRNIQEYISGYVDGEGCFSVSFSKREKFLVGWETKPSFSVSQNEDRAQILFLMQKELHKNKDGLRKILDLAFQMNPSGKRKYTKAEMQKALR